MLRAYHCREAAKEPLREHLRRESYPSARRRQRWFPTMTRTLRSILMTNPLWRGQEKR